MSTGQPLTANPLKGRSPFELRQERSETSFGPFEREADPWQQQK